MKNLEQLIEALKSDEDLRTKLATAGNDEAACEAILEEEGYAVKAADLREYAESHAKDEPTDEELRGVAGGGTVTDVLETANSVVATGIFGIGAVCWE